MLCVCGCRVCHDRRCRRRCRCLRFLSGLSEGMRLDAFVSGVCRKGAFVELAVGEQYIIDAYLPQEYVTSGGGGGDDDVHALL